MTKKRNQTTGKSPAEPSSNEGLTGTIDLHGYQRSEGIKRLTSFLEQVVSRQRKLGNYSDIWVLVITGSGAHSPDGPMLRSAVQAVLEKRKMEFTVNRGKGSFTVKANSGVVFYEPGPPVDTKLILKDALERIPPLPRPKRMPNSGSVPLAPDCIDNAPTPGEVVALEKVLEESRKDHQEYYREQKKDEKVMKRAVSMSMLEAKREEEEDHQEEMQRALSMSLLEYNPSGSSDFLDEDLQRVLELSQKDFQFCPDESSSHHDENLQRALELSRHVSSRADEEILRALELSKRDPDYPQELWTQGSAEDAE